MSIYCRNSIVLERLYYIKVIIYFDDNVPGNSTSTPLNVISATVRITYSVKLGRNCTLT